MNREEALLIYRNCEDVEECWEEKLLEHLNFFRSKAIIPSVFRSRLDRLEREAEAAELILEERFPVGFNEIELPSFNGNLRALFDAYYTGVNDLTGEMFRNPSVENIRMQVERLIGFSNRYYMYLHDQLKWDFDEVKVSVLPDPMYIYAAIDAYELKGIMELHDLNSETNDALVSEIKRMIQLFKSFYKDV